MMSSRSPRAAPLAAALCCVFAAALAGSAGGRLRAAGATFLLTADTEGQIDPCADCPEGAGLGGLARRAALVARLRAEPGGAGLLLVDAGGSLFGPGSLESRGRAVAAAYESMAYDALNVSWRDFRLGKEATLSLFAASKVIALSSNLVDAAKGELLFKPYAVLRAGGERIALLGATEAPAGLDVLPHLREQLAGVRVRPPLEAIAEWLPRARSEADRVVLLYYGSAAGLRPLAERFGGQLAVVLAGGARPEDLGAGTSPPLVGTAARGARVARVRLEEAGPAARAMVEQIALDRSVEPDPALERLLAPLRPAPKGLEAGAGPPAAAAGRADPAPLLPPSLELSRTYRLDLVAGNRAVRVTVLAARADASYGELAAPESSRLLVLDTEWENRIPLSLLGDKEVPTEYRVPRLGDHVYLVADGLRVVRLREDAAELPGHLPAQDFRLERVGSRLRGNLVFEVPGVVERLELRYYDFAHGHFAAPLLGLKGGAGAVKSIGPLQRNEVVEAGVYRFERIDALGAGGPPAPGGMAYVAVDLRGRSVFEIDAEASSFDPKAKRGARLKVGTVADWKDARRHLWLVADGEYGCAPLGEGSWAFPEELRLLPDVPTGARAVFLAPGKALSIELRCDFPNAQPQGAAQALRPRGLVFPLEGKRPQIPMRRALVAIDDGVFQVAVIGQAAAESFAGEAAGEGKAFLVLDVTVVNTGKGGETFQTLEQLKVATRTGEQLAADPASLRGLRPPAALLWIPEGEPRSFQVAFRVPADERKPRLAYSGVTLAKVVDLPPLAGAEVAAAATRPEPSPPPEPAGPAGRPAGEPEKEAKDDKVAKDAKPARAPVEGPETLEKPAKAATPPPPAAKKAPAAPKKAKRDAAPLVPPPPPGEPKGLAGVGLTPEKVNEAIDGGAAFLWRHIVTKDLQGGRYKLGSDQEHAIAALALVHAGAHEKVPDFDAQLREYLSKVEPDRVGAYQAGILCMLVEAYGDPSFLGVLRGATRYLLEAQGPEGSWTYHTRLKDDVYRDPEAEKTILVSGGVPLEGEAAAPELARTTEWRLGQDGDNSVSQYAVLGLHAASRSGLRLSPEVWTRGLAAYRARQGDDGNWYYTGKSSSGYGSMTCAGVCSVAIALHELGEKEPAKDPAVQAGLAWLSRSFSVSEHPGSKGRWHYYYLYALERVGRVLGTDFIGEHEWYPEGARYLVDAQKEDGGWVGEGEEKDPRLAASFALLFLTRATPTLKAQEVRRGGKGLLKTGIRLPPGGRYYFILDASGSMTAELGGKPKWEIARDAVQSLVAALPDASDVALRVYGHRKRAIEPGASEDTALEVPLRRLERAQFDQKLRALRARGKTPLALSLLQAKRDLSGAREEDPVIVVLLTDGGEDTQPRQDPVKAAADFGELEGVALHVVGFDIGREDWSAQLREMVARAHGRYWPAADGPTLERHLRAAVLGEPEGYVVLGAGGEQAARGRFGDTRTLPEGKYVLRVAFGGEEHEQGFWINTDATTSVVFNAERAARGLPSEATPGAARPEGPAQPAAAAPEARPKPPPEPAPKTAPAKFCTECGKPLKPAARFCTECGTKVK